MTINNAINAGGGTSTTVLHGNATGSPTYGSVVLTTDVSGTLPVGNGGTGITSGTSGGVPYFSSTSTIASSGAGTTTTVLHGNASGAPTFGAVGLTTDVSGILPIANGGTNANAGNQNTSGINFFNGTSIISGTILTFNGTTQLALINAASLSVMTVKTSLSGSANTATLQIARGDVPNGSANIAFFNNTTAQWTIGLQSGGNSLYFHDVSTNLDRLILTQTGSVTIPSLTASQVVLTDGSSNLTTTGTLGVGLGGTGSSTTFTQGSVVFAGSSGIYSQNNSTFFWGNTGGPGSAGSLSIGSTSTTYTFSAQNASTSNVALFQSSATSSTNLVDVFLPNLPLSNTFTAMRIGVNSTTNNFGQIGFSFIGSTASQLQLGSGGVPNSLAIDMLGTVSINVGNLNFLSTARGISLVAGANLTNVLGTITTTVLLGSFNLTGTTPVVVANTHVASTSFVFVTHATPVGTLGSISCTVSTSQFSVKSTSTSDTSLVFFIIFNPV